MYYQALFLNFSYEKIVTVTASLCVPISTVEPLLSDPFGGVPTRLDKEWSDNRKAKMTSLNGVGRVDLRSDN